SNSDVLPNDFGEAGLLYANLVPSWLQEGNRIKSAIRSDQSPFRTRINILHDDISTRHNQATWVGHCSYNGPGPCALRRGRSSHDQSDCDNREKKPNASTQKSIAFHSDPLLREGIGMSVILRKTLGGHKLIAWPKRSRPPTRAALRIMWIHPALSSWSRLTLS